MDILVWLQLILPDQIHLAKLSAHQCLLVFVDGFLHRLATNRLGLDVLLPGTQHATCFRAVELLLEALQRTFDVFSLFDRNDEHDGKLGREDSLDSKKTHRLLALLKPFVD